MKQLLYIITFFMSSSIFSQTISIGLFEKGYAIEIRTKKAYEKKYGVGNVTVNYYGDNYNTPYSILKTNDVVIVNTFFKNDLTQTLADNIIKCYKDNIHIVLTTEGSRLVTGERFSSYVWNEITGESISETPGGAYGTQSPPRFHPSSGPGGLSTNSNLIWSSTSYTSFGDLNPKNVLHQRTEDRPDCGNVEGLDALFPHLPKTGEGTIYINGEIYYPFYSTGSEVEDLADNIVTLHYTLLTNDKKTLENINSWYFDYRKRTTFSLNKEDVDITFPNIFTPNNDFINDIYKIKHDSKEPIDFVFRVTNRWGNEIFYTKNIHVNWTGKNLSEGTYFFYAKAKFKNDCYLYPDIIELEYKGYIMIVR